MYKNKLKPFFFSIGKPKFGDEDRKLTDLFTAHYALDNKNMKDRLSILTRIAKKHNHDLPHESRPLIQKLNEIPDIDACNQVLEQLEMLRNKHRIDFLIQFPIEFSGDLIACAGVGFLATLFAFILLPIWGNITLVTTVLAIAGIVAGITGVIFGLIIFLYDWYTGEGLAVKKYNRLVDITRDITSFKLTMLEVFTPILSEQERVVALDNPTMQPLESTNEVCNIFL